MTADPGRPPRPEPQEQELQARVLQRLDELVGPRDADDDRSAWARIDAALRHRRVMQGRIERLHKGEKGCGSCGEPGCCPAEECGYKGLIHNLEAERDQLREALQTYGQHKPGCPVLVETAVYVTCPHCNGTGRAVEERHQMKRRDGTPWPENNCAPCAGSANHEWLKYPTCTCGFSALLAAADAPGEGR